MQSHAHTAAVKTDRENEDNICKEGDRETQKRKDRVGYKEVKYCKPCPIIHNRNIVHVTRQADR